MIVSVEDPSTLKAASFTLLLHYGAPGLFNFRYESSETKTYWYKQAQDDIL